MSLARSALNKEQIKAANIVLSPQNEETHWADFSTTALAIERGEEEVDRKIGALQRALKKARWQRFLGWGNR